MSPAMRVPANRKLGKQQKRHDARNLCLARYLLPSLPPAPETFNLLAKVTDIGLMRNDVIGDCTCAAAGHLVQVWTAENGSQVVIPDEAIVAAYSAITGYNPADPTTDQGAVELDVLNYWRGTGIANHTIGAYATLAPNDVDELKQAIYIFGGIYTGFALPLCVSGQDSWELPPWWRIGGAAKAGSWGGHAVPIVGYDATHCYIISWGKVMPVSWDFVKAYCDEAYAVISHDQVNLVDATPSGFNTAQLQQDLAAL